MEEFDKYANDYEVKKSSWLKRILGIADDSLLGQKLCLLKEEILESQAKRVLDFGCGAGDLVARLNDELGLESHVLGADPSSGMIGVARARYPHLADNFIGIKSLAPSGRRNKFDLIVMSSVLHHVELKERVDTVSFALKLLDDKGKLVVFEHNPFNIFTQLAVRFTPIDKHATLLSPKSLGFLHEMPGLEVSRAKYFLFIPPDWPFSRRIDSLLKRVPFGGQWTITASLKGL